MKRNYQSFAAEMSDLSPLELRIVETVTLSKQLRTRLNRLRPRRTAQQPSARIWSAGIVDTIYIIGDWLDPTSHVTYSQQDEQTSVHTEKRDRLSLV